MNGYDDMLDDYARQPVTSNSVHDTSKAPLHIGLDDPLMEIKALSSSSHVGGRHLCSPSSHAALPTADIATPLNNTICSMEVIKSTPTTSPPSSVLILVVGFQDGHIRFYDTNYWQLLDMRTQLSPVVSMASAVHDHQHPPPPPSTTTTTSTPCLYCIKFNPNPGRLLSLAVNGHTGHLYAGFNNTSIVRIDVLSFIKSFQSIRTKSKTIKFLKIGDITKLSCLLPHDTGLLSGSGDGQLLWWPLHLNNATGSQEVVPLLGHRGAVFCLAAGYSGEVYSGSADDERWLLDFIRQCGSYRSETLEHAECLKCAQYVAHKMEDIGFTVRLIGNNHHNNENGSQSSTIDWEPASSSKSDDVYYVMAL
ncbi:hypothetical protein FOZ60_009930 [Perkinsus olseni]|uniref:Uncharacterized protein n=1 Tax=Perkinsus olseni TaxID=32597 RepID=A0A7J6PMG8_PEROL|nr:hypothetical protein FOZ60_009930 [Perkinsus olseni]